MLESILNNTNFLDIMSDFSKSYELNIKYENSLFETKIVLNEVEYKSSNSDIVECLKLMINEYLIIKAKNNNVTVEELTNGWKTLEELILEIKES